MCYGSPGLSQDTLGMRPQPTQHTILIPINGATSSYKAVQPWCIEPRLFDFGSSSPQRCAGTYCSLNSQST